MLSGAAGSVAYKTRGANTLWPTEKKEYGFLLDLAWQLCLDDP